MGRISRYHLYKGKRFFKKTITESWSWNKDIKNILIILKLYLQYSVSWPQRMVTSTIHHLYIIYTKYNSLLTSTFYPICPLHSKHHIVHYITIVLCLACWTIISSNEKNHIFLDYQCILPTYMESRLKRFHLAYSYDHTDRKRQSPHWILHPLIPKPELLPLYSRCLLQTIVKKWQGPLKPCLKSYPHFSTKSWAIFPNTVTHLL